MAIFKPFKHEMDIFMTYSVNGKQRPNVKLRPSGPVHLSTSTSTSTATATSTGTKPRTGRESTYSTPNPLEPPTHDGKAPSPSPFPTLTLQNITPIASASTEAEAEADEAATLSELRELESKILKWESLAPLSAIKPTVLARPKIGLGLEAGEARGVYVYEHGYGWVTGTGTRDEDSNGIRTEATALQRRSDVAGLRQRLRRSQDREADDGDESDSDDTRRIVHLRGLLLSLQEPAFIASLGTSMSRKQLASLFAWMSARDLERSVIPSTATHGPQSGNGADECGSGILKVANINQIPCLGSREPSNVQSKKVRWGLNTTVQLEKSEEEPARRTGLRPRSTQQTIMQDLIEFD